MRISNLIVTKILFHTLGIITFFLIPQALAQPDSSDQKPITELDQLKTEIEQRIHEYETALKNGDFLALGNMYTIDAEILHHGSPSTIGRENITTVFKKMIADSVTNSGFTTTGLWGNNELLVEQGTGFFAHASGKWISKGRYLLVWKKVEGKWQIFRDTWFKLENQN